MPTERLDTLPRTERFAKLDWPAAGMTLRLASALVTRSSCLLFQFCRIEAFSWPVTSSLLPLSVADRLRGGRRELKAEFFSPGRQTFDPILSVSLFVSLRTLIHVRLSPPEQAVNYGGQFPGKIGRAHV